MLRAEVCKKISLLLRGCTKTISCPERVRGEPIVGETLEIRRKKGLAPAQNTTVKVLARSPVSVLPFGNFYPTHRSMCIV